MEHDESRWKLPDLDAAISRCRSRNRQKIRCILHGLGEHAGTRAEAQRSLEESRECLQAIAAHDLDASVSCKLTAFGAAADPQMSTDLVMRICAEAQSSGIRVELDMEGRNLVDFTLASARRCGARNPAPGIALQAYLDRTDGDLADAIAAGLRVRIVKGAYIGDIDDFSAIQRRFMALCTQCAHMEVPFAVGTHDQDLVAWITRTMPDRKSDVEFGFLMGFADETKQRLARDGWRVAEYVPYGAEGGTYVIRRMHYLDGLFRQGRQPLP